MYIMYLDDSGSVSNKTEKNFVLAGVIIHESKLRWVNSKIDELAKQIDAQQYQDIEFHASEEYARRKGTVWEGYTKENAISTIKDVLAVIPDEGRDKTLLCVVGCVVEKKHFSSQDPTELAFENLCNRFDIFLKRRHFESKQIETGIIIFDKSTSETSLQRLALNFKTVGTRWKVTRNIHEVPLFVDSRSSRGIQLADHVAYALFRRFEHCDLNYYNVFQGHFDSDNDRMHGLVHKTYDHTCTCPACIIRRFSSES